MITKRIKPFGLACLLILISFAGIAFGSFTQIFVPSTSPEANDSTYYAGTKHTDEIGYAPVHAGVNFLTGYTSVYTSAWVGGSAASAWQCIRFETPFDSTVTAEVNIMYVGGVITYGAASFADTAWQWQLDNHSVHRNYIDPAFTWDDVTLKILDIVLGLLGECGISDVEAAAELGELILTAPELTLQLNQAIKAGKGEHLIETCTFTTEPGVHLLWVGIRADASGCLTGSGFGIMFGEIPMITLRVEDTYGSPPDLAISDIATSRLRPQRGDGLWVSISNYGGTPLADYQQTGYTFSVREPNEVNFIKIVSYDPITTFRAHYTIYKEPNYVFPKRGTYTLKAVVDPYNNIGNDTDRTNNQMIKDINVTGLPPNKPAKPTVPSDHILTRNNSYTFRTSTTDPDGDPLKYNFIYQRQEDIGWSVSGWSDSNSFSFTPTGIDNNSPEGTYSIYCRAIDTDGLLSELSDEEYFVVAANNCPNAPDINAPANDYNDTTIKFTVHSNDKENDWVGYRFDWGDGSAITNYYWPSDRGASYTITHKFHDVNTYYVQVQAKDYLGATSSWSTHQIGITKYVAPAGSITVTSNIEDAWFYISGPNSFNGSGAHWTTQAVLGDYGITFWDVPYYDTPDGDSQHLYKDQSITFNGNYTHQEGEIDVNTNASALFKVTGYGAAEGAAILGRGRLEGPTTSTAGEWRITYDSVTGYCLPMTNNEKKSLLGNQSIVFNGRYTHMPVASLDFNIPARGFAIAGEDAIKFDASASYVQEPDINIVKYEFNFGDGDPYIESTDVNAPDGNNDGITYHVYIDRDWYSPVLYIYDTLGNKVRKDSNRWIQVKCRPNAYIYSITPSPAIEGETVAFSGRGYDYDGDAIIAWQWQSNIDGNLSTAKDFNTNHLTPGFHTISFKVQDSNSLWSPWVTKQLNVYKALDWPMFKENAPRISSQATYSGRIHGLLGYSQSWSSPANGQITGSPVAANLDGNSVNGLEIAFATQTVAGNAGNLYVLNNNGTLRWFKNIGSSKSTPAIGDIDNDGNLDIVVGSSTGVHAYTKDGNSIYDFNDPVPGLGFDSTPVIADIDGNSNNGKETIIGSNDGHVYAIGKNGMQRWAFPPMGGAAFTSSAAVADIEPNWPGLETVIAGNDGVLYVLSSNGFLIASYATPAPIRPITTTPAIADFAQGVPGPEILFGSDDGKLYCVNYSNINNNPALNLVWTYATGALLPIKSSPAIGFLGGSGGSSYASEVAFGCDDGKVYVLKEMGGWPACIGTFQCAVAVRSTPVIANIDSINNMDPIYGDLPEVIVGANDGRLYIISFSQGAVNPPPLPLSVGSSLLSSPAVADIDHAPDLEILIGSTNSNLYMVKATPSALLAPVANFSAPAIQRVGNPPRVVTFMDQSTNSPFSWLWDFGDYNTSTDQNAMHIYNTPGTYSVSLTVTNAHGTNTLTDVNYITVNPVPVAAFTHTPASGTIPLQVDFTDQSQYGPTSWSWTFGDGGTSSSQNPSHTYSEPNLYTVTLTASNTYGSSVITKTGCVLARAPQPIANFTQDVTYGQSPLSVSFTDTSTGQPTSWLWNFGDDSNSVQQNPSHQYSSAGNFLASLTVSNSTGSDTRTNSFYIRVGHKLCDFNHDGIVDFEDLALLVDDWLQTNSVFVGDIAPSPNGDGTVNLTDFARFAQDWLQ
jgi:PKD repeat protein